MWIIMTTSSREALARGDVRALVESIGPDDEWHSPDGGYLARVGRTNIMVAPDGDVSLHTHDTDEDAGTCFRGKVDQLTMFAEMAAQGPAGILAALQQLGIVMPADDSEGEATVSLPTAVGRGTVPGTYEVSATPPPTGLYL